MSASDESTSVGETAATTDSASQPPQPRPRMPPFPKWIWPLTHRQRIEELRAFVLDEGCQIHEANINAAIQCQSQSPALRQPLRMI